MTAAIAAVAAPAALDPRNQIEAGLLARLESLSQRQGGYVEALGSYHGELAEGQSLEDLQARLRGRTPAVLVTVGAVSYQSRSVRRRLYRATYTCELAVISQHWGSREIRERGDLASHEVAQADPGVHAILGDVFRLLAGRRLTAPGSEIITPLGESPVLDIPDLVAWVARYEVALWVSQGAPVVYPTAESLTHRHHLEDSEPVNPVAEGDIDATS